MTNQGSHYLISRVRYNPQRTHITHVEVSRNFGSYIGQTSIWSRQEVVTALRQGYTFTTTLRTASGSYSRGAYVRIHSVNGVDYLRTDGNSRVGDNLGELPEF